MERPVHYWLFKSEPGCFSFTDLAARSDGTEHWDGVRNYQARNLLRDEVRRGDLLFFYHSGIAEPSIVGIAVVVREGYPDWTALDPANEHFDPRCSPEHPVWYMVDVQYVRPLARPVTLRELRQHPGLHGMELFQRSRLSIQPVSPEHWQLILQLSGDS